MNALEAKRRSFLFGLGGLGISQVLPLGMTRAQAEVPQGYVLGAAEGEHLVHFRDHGNIFIKAGAATGSDNLALGTQQVTVGAGIPIHRHLKMDEAFYVLEGSGIFILNDVRHPFEKGGTIFIPKNSWHGFANPDHELLILWKWSQCPISRLAGLIRTMPNWITSESLTTQKARTSHNQFQDPKLGQAMNSES